jgi:light-regulated signal transduction histidine kinase (bacteriophytochrome)
MSDFQVNLNNCDVEPIHIPGFIQSQGFLVALDQAFNIRFCSDNTERFVGVSYITLMGKPLLYLESIINHVDHPDFITQLLNIGRGKKGFEPNNPYEVVISGISYNLIISASRGFTLLEFEPSITISPVNIQSRIGSSLSEMLGDRNLKSLLKNSAVEVKNIIQYDRVMIYRFADDDHGEVVAESKNKKLESWLGLHYPASDIPRQARELYKKNHTRLIADVASVPSKIAADASNVGPLDLSSSELRAVSPIHIQYLKNMGVASSFSISLIYKNELWGLIACHNYTPRFIDYSSRKAAKLIGQILSSALEFRQDDENQKIHKDFDENLDKLAKLLMKHDTIAQALTQNRINLLSIVKASGAVLVYDGVVTTLGITPDEGQLKKLIKWIAQKRTKFFYHSEQLSAVFPEALAYKHLASGMMVSVLDRERKEYIIWFKPEQIHAIQWAGNPQKPLEVNEDGLLQISPRLSFQTWEETVLGKSDKWTAQEINSVKRLKEEVTYSINFKARAIQDLNQKLKLAYEELDTFSYTISHDLKNPLAVIKMYAQMLSKDSNDQERRNKIFDSIGKGADKMNSMITDVLEYSKLGRSEIQFQQIDADLMIRDIIRDMMVVYEHLILNITVGKTPNLYGDKLMMTQVFANLIGNAIKYSQKDVFSEIHIEGEIKNNKVYYSIKDNGIGISTMNLLKVFDLFRRVDTTKNIEGDGVGLAIVKRIVDRHEGLIWVESILGEGSTFFLRFNIPVHAPTVPLS